LSPAELEEAMLLLRKAREDADAVGKLASDQGIADSVVGFHAQQAAEKSMKAVLASCGDEFPWTHDLRHLMDRLDVVAMPLPDSLYDVRALAPWAVEFRYGETIDDQLDREQALTLAREVIVWAEASVDAAARTQQVTEHDRDQGIVRVPARSKWLFPEEPARITVVLGEIRLDEVRWDPRLGPDRERSGVLGIGKNAASRLMEGETLRITWSDGGVRLD
jgi:HEPN domain-containing protein